MYIYIIPIGYVFYTIGELPLDGLSKAAYGRFSKLHSGKMDPGPGGLSY